MAEMDRTFEEGLRLGIKFINRFLMLLWRLG